MGTFRFVAVLVQVRNRPVQNQQKQDPQPKSRGCRKKCPSSHAGCLFHSGHQQAPHGRRRHDACRESGQGPLERRVESLPYGEDAGRAQGGSEKGQENSLHDFFLHYTASVTNLSLEEKYVC